MVEIGACLCNIPNIRDGIVREIGACLCNIPNITNKNRHEQQIDPGNKIGLKLKKKKKKKIERNSPTRLHCTWMLISLVLSVANKRNKNVSVKYEMRVALYGCGPRILRYCSSVVEGRVKERKRG